MKKAKTRKNLITILCAIIGVVFAFSTGVTYCANSINLQYGINPKSTQAYLANQQYHVINDTIDNPILFGEGSHNFEIAIQYSIDYDFDVRLKYSMTWSEGVTLANESTTTKASNVILHFANRDNVIYDEDFIFIANHVPAGSGKLNIITGVDFVDSTDSQYYGQTLTINILDCKIVKKQNSYDKSTHALTVQDSDANTNDTNISTSLAAEAWIYYKNKATSSNAYVMVYNQRRNYDTGIPYSGLTTAYKKSTNLSNVVTSSSWLGGNKAYDGTGMYIITGTSSIKLQVKIGGIWRDKNNEDVDKSVISENSIRYNYTSEWLHASWDASRLWETRTFNYVIPQNSAYYIDFLDSIEIISADRIEKNMYDSYRLVTNSIILNPGLSSQNEFTYDEYFADYVQMQTISSNASLGVTNSYADVVEDRVIEVINSSIYSNGLYDSMAGQTSAIQTFNTNINLINNSATTKTVTITYQLNYTISNGNTKLTNVTETDGVYTYTRAEEYFSDTYKEQQAFKDNLYYSYSLTTSQLATSNLLTKVTIDPYSSVNIGESYRVSANLRGEISTLFDPLNDENVQEDGLTDYYDVWTFLTVTPSVQQTTESLENITIEKSKNNDGQVEFSVKNNTESTITGVEISSFTVEELDLVENSYELEESLNAPNDWIASYWKYYTRSGTVGNYTYTQLKAAPTYVASQYWKLTQEYKDLSYSFANGFDYYKEYDNNDVLTKTDTSLIVNSTKVLQPGESIVFATATTSLTGQVKFNGFATTSNVQKEQKPMLINEGDYSAYIINASTTTSYCIRFTGSYSGGDTIHFKSITKTVNEKQVTYNYYMEILRPGQILNVPMSAVGDMTTADMVEVTANLDSSALTTKGWDSSIVTDFTNMFKLK